MPTDEPSSSLLEPRKKRAKIISACGECRRKKTKCNGELPCRSCSKSSVACVYPSLGNMDERRNAPTKAALEAIEERLKSIEDMLKAILQSRYTMLDLDPEVVANFVKDKQPVSSTSLNPSPRPSVSILPGQRASPTHSGHTSPTTASSPPHSHPPTQHHPLQPAVMTGTSTHVQRPVPTAPIYHHHHHLPPQRDNMLPPIHSLSAPPPAYDRLPVAQDHAREYYAPTGFQSFRPLSHAHEAPCKEEHHDLPSSYPQPDDYRSERSEDKDKQLEPIKTRKL